MTDREKLVELINNGVEIYTDGWQKQFGAAEAVADHMIANGVTVQENSRKAEDCRYYTQKSFWGAGRLGTKEIDPCKGDGCERWKSKEDA